MFYQTKMYVQFKLGMSTLYMQKILCSLNFLQTFLYIIIKKIIFLFVF